MKMKYLPIVSAVFLIIAMTLQFWVSYQWERKRVQGQIDYEMQLAQRDFLFEIYDIQHAGDEVCEYLQRRVDDQEAILHFTRVILTRYEDIKACYVSFRPGYYNENEYWHCPCSWRKGDSIVMEMYGNAENDYFQRDWYKGALQSVQGRYWSSSYMDKDFKDFVCTHSIRVEIDNQFACVVGLDLSTKWMRDMMERIKPYDDAYCRIFDSDGNLILASRNIADAPDINIRNMIVSTSKLSPMDLQMEIGVPKNHVWEEVRGKSLLTFIVLLIGILVAAMLIRRIWFNQAEYTRVETENQLMEREMHIASDIQKGILRKGERNKIKGGKWPDVELNAALIPMREVGGDLYDYFRKDDSLYFIIGDVSGKSVPAAMFMSATVNLFRSAVRRQTSPKAIMEEMNAVLSDNNPSFMFVTAFIGRLHIPTGELLYCNAGHLAPIKIGKNFSPAPSPQEREGGVETLQLVPNIPMGYEGTFRFVEQGTMLGKDELLVLYTDGITEARNEKHELLGMKRWIELVKNNEQALRNGDLAAIDEAGMQFVGKAEQADDMTLMTILKTSDSQPLTMHVENQLSQWPELKTAFHNYALCVGLDKRTLKKMEIALEEAVINIVHYSQAEWIELTLSHQHSAISIQLTDNGVAFDPTKQEEKDINKAVEERQIGGLGIALVQQIADQMLYRRIEDKNELTIIKNI